MATILYPDGRQEERQPANGRDFQLDELQAIVGGHIEIVSTKDGRILVCNDESKLLGLPRNDQATAMVNFPSPREMMETLRTNPDIIFVGEIDDIEVDYIAGTVLLCKDEEDQ
jgi:hypothetical protein